MRHIVRVMLVRLLETCFDHISTFSYTEFAFEIGSGLLTEVRRLQSLLGERDKVIQDMKEEKEDLERLVESLRTTIQQSDKGLGMVSKTALL